jgi:mono/diheme cytochrome c family protein
MSVSPSNKTTKLGIGKRLRWPALLLIAFIALLWLVPELLPEDSGWRLGAPFRIFYTAITLLGGLFFLLVELPSPKLPTTTGGVWVRISVVYLVTIGFLVAIGMVFPNFEIPSGEIVAGELPAERGRELFFDSANTCILCHAVDGQGGTRGPDLSGVATRASDRVPGLTAEEYLRQSIQESTAFVVEGFEPIMPPGLINVIGEENLDDLIAFLLSLE